MNHFAPSKGAAPLAIGAAPAPLREPPQMGGSPGGFSAPSTLAGPAARRTLGAGRSVKEWLGNVAMYDKRLAYVLGQSFVSHGDPFFGSSWEIINITGTFSSAAANQIVHAQTNRGLETDFWIQKVTYTVQRPNAFAGNIFKAQSDEFNKLNPDINFLLIVESFCKFVISPDFTPLENIPNIFECVCPAGLVLTCASGIRSEFQNIRALSADEVPTIVTISLHARRLPLGLYAGCTGAYANRFLIENDICCEDGCDDP